MTLKASMAEQLGNNRSMGPMKYMVYDIESIVDRKLLNRIAYAGEGLTDDEAYQKHVDHLMETRGSNFVNAVYHIPVCLAALAVNKDYSLQKIGLLGGDDKRTPGSITSHFWDVYNSKSPVLVDFNGSGYDVRLMELWAYRQGISVKGEHFAKFGARYRFADDKHLDLQDALNNNGSIRYTGGLNLFSKLLGKPGKMETKGDMVEELYAQGKMFEIEDYCLGDTLDTYFVFLRWMVVKGQLNLNKEQRLVEGALDSVRNYSKETGYLKKYLENCQEWQPWE